LASRSGRHYMADSLMLYEGGVTGVVNGQTVAAGSLSFLQALEIQVPDGVRVSSAVYVAIDGELCGLFAITYEKLRSAAAGIHALCAYRGLNPLVVSDDFALTENFLRSKFGLPGQRLLFPEYEIRQQLREKLPAQEDTVALLTTRSDLAASAFGVIGARALYNACRLGMILHLLGGMLGIAVMVVLTLLGALHLLTPVNMLLYQLVWMLPGLMITEWTRHL